MSKPQLILIAAVAKNRAIGLDNQLLWRLPEDLKRFKALTLGSPILMGRKTFESLGRPLPGRRNLVLSRNPSWQAEGAEVFATLEEALASCAALDKVYVIGGEQIYRLTLAMADLLELTEVDDAPKADAFFPELPENVWLAHTRQACLDPLSGIHFDFVQYQRAI